ncbi:MAG: histidine kinase [Bacteroidota bacterium]
MDSLKTVAMTDTLDYERMKALWRICSIYNRAETNDDDSLRIYANRGVVLSSSLDSLGLQAYFTTFYAATYYYEDTSMFFKKMREAEDLNLRSDSKIKYLKAAMTTHNAAMQYNEFKQHTAAVAALKRGLSYLDRFDASKVKLWYQNKTRITDRIYGQLVKAYREMADYEKCIQTLFEQENFLKKHKNFSGLLEAYLQYHHVYSDIISQKRMVLSPDELKPYKNKLLRNLQKASHLSDSLGSVFGRKGVPSYLYGQYFEEEGAFEQAKICYEASIEISKEQKMIETLMLSYISLAGIYIEENRTEDAYKFILTADSLTQKINSPSKFQQLYETYTKYFLKKKSSSEAKIYIEHAHKSMLQNASLETKAAHYELRHRVALANNQPVLALEYYKKQIQLKDSLAGLQLAETLEELRGQYVNSQKDVEIAKLNEEKASQQLIYQRIIGFALVLLLLILFISFSIYQHNQNKILEAKQKSSELKHRLLRSQMNPHFTFNALGAIQNYLLVSDKPNRAAYFLAKFAKLMRQILDQSIAPLISVEEELDTLENYLTIQKLRYDSKFEFSIDVAEGICKEKTQIPPVLIQPLLENAIEHGKIHKQENGIVRVEMAEKEGLINVTVSDNGVGLSNSKTSSHRKEYQSVSTNIIEERINMLRSKYGGDIRYQAIERQEGGTESLLVLPKIVQ